MTYAVLSISAAKRLAKTYTKAQASLEAIGAHLALAGVQTLAASAKKSKPKKSRKAKATKSAKPAPPKAPAKPTDPLTA